MKDEEEFLIAGPDGRAISSGWGIARLDQIAGVLFACRSSFYETADAFHWTPQPDSPAALVAATLPSPDPLIEPAREETGHRLVTGAVQTYLQTAAGFLGALGTLYDSGEVFVAPGTVVRGALESVARVFWILGDGSDHPEQMLARAYPEEFLSAEAAKGAASRLGGESSEQSVSRTRMWRDLRAEILNRFPGATKSDLAEGGGRELAGERLASPSGGVTAMFDILERHAGSSISNRESIGMYDFLSSSTHPTLYQSRQRRLWLLHPDHPGERVAHEKVELVFARKQAGVAVLTYCSALTYVTSYFGWLTDVCDTLTAAIDEALPGTLLRA